MTRSTRHPSRDLSAILLLAFLMLNAGCATTKAPVIEKGQTAQSFQRNVTTSFSGSYLIYVPEDYGDEERTWPLMLFLHGGGERGADLELVKKHGPPKRIEAGESFPFIIVSPQAPENGWWDSAYLLALLDEIMDTYDVDPNRVYLTGLSMGGYGAWDLATRAPERFAAIAPICGGGFRWMACKMKDIPVWAFHGAQDTVVPIEESEKMVDAINACGGNATLTVYPDTGHDAWTETYDNPELYDWFLSHSLNE